MRVRDNESQLYFWGVEKNNNQKTYIIWTHDSTNRSTYQHIQCFQETHILHQC